MIARELWWANQFSFVVIIIPPWFPVLIYHLRDENRPIGGCSSET
jgi:hypothetical protein